MFDGTTLEADVIDVGQGGIRLQTDESIRPGTWLQMQIVPYDSQLRTVQCHGTVRWHSLRRQAHIVGVQLEGSTGQIRQWLAGLRTISAAE